MKTRDGKVTIDIGQCDGEDLLELSVSKAKKWRGCQQAYKYRYMDKLIPKMKARPLTLGSLVHLCLENRAEGLNWVKAIQDFKKNEWAKLFDEERIELGDIPTDAYRIMRGYHFFYMESDKRYKTIGSEIPFRVRIEGTPVVLVGIIDLILLDTTDNSIWCFEHKTAKKDIPTEEFRMTDIQTTIYMYVMDKLAPSLGYKASQVKGVVLDYLKTKAPTMPEVLKNGTLSKRKITCDYYTYMECIKGINGDPADYEEILEYMKSNVFYRRVPITKSTAMTELTLKDMVNVGRQIKALSGKCITRNLSWNCDRPKCEYRDLCIAEIQGFDISTLIKISFEKREEENKDGEESDSEPS